MIASHNMRELEDVCDHVGFLHKGGILLSRELEDMKFHIHKIQCVLPDQTKEEALLKELDVLKKEHQGSLLILTARGTREEILQKVQTQESNILRSDSIDTGGDIYQRNGGGRL